MIKNRKNKKALLISRKDAFNIENISEFIFNNFDTTILIEDRDKKLPLEINSWSGDYIFSYLCPWILPLKVIRSAKIAAVNFHPGPPSYPGSGCYNFAIYNQEKEYGVTCHHLDEKVDAGQIISIKKFPLYSTDKISDLINRTYVYLNFLLFEITSNILRNETLPKSSQDWERKPYTIKDLDNLCKLSKKMSDEEITRRVRATTFPGKPGPYFID